MAGKVRTGALLVKESFKLLKEHPEWLSFPIMSVISTLLIVMTFVLPAGISQMGPYIANFAKTHGPVFWFTLYFVLYYISIFFNVALTFCVVERLEGRERSVSWALSATFSRISQVTGWAIIAATVATALRLLQDQAKNNILLRIVIGLIGISWAVATFFVIPVLVVENVNPIEAIKRSMALLKNTWGEGATGSFTLGIISFFITLALMMGMMASFVLIAVNPIAGFVMLVVSFITFYFYCLVMGTVRSVLHVVLYQYASGKKLPPNFSPELLQAAMVPKKK